MAAKSKIEQVNIANVKTLFRDIRGIINSDKSQMEIEIDKLDEEYLSLETKLLDNKRLKELSKKIDQVRKSNRTKQKELHVRLGKIERRFYADGPTSQVMNALRKMLDEIDGPYLRP